MRRALLPATASTLLLAASIATWPELFLFAKTFYPPTWVRALPSVLLAAPLVAAVCLLPVAAASPRPSSVARWLLAPVSLAPLAGVAIYVAARAERGPELWANAIFHYFWIVAFHLLVPAVLVFFSSFAVHHIKRHWPDRQSDA